MKNVDQILFPMRKIKKDDFKIFTVVNSLQYSLLYFSSIHCNILSMRKLSEK